MIYSHISILCLGEGTAAKVPQNYPDVTLHPVAIPSSAAQNTASQPTGSLLHGILTKAQSPRSTTFSPTLARLLTAPERERNSPAAAAAAAVASMSQQSATTQHFSQTYQGSNLVSINDILSSSKVFCFFYSLQLLIFLQFKSALLKSAVFFNTMRLSQYSNVRTYYNQVLYSL